MTHDPTSTLLTRSILARSTPPSADSRTSCDLVATVIRTGV